MAVAALTALLIAAVVLGTRLGLHEYGENPVTQIDPPQPAPAPAPHVKLATPATTEFSASEFNALDYGECMKSTPGSILRRPTTMANEDKAASLIDVWPAPDSLPAWAMPCPLDRVRFCTNLTFEAHCDDSRSNTTIKCPGPPGAFKRPWCFPQ
jgi:hypothetical protein